jgi:hypothetical protein
MTQTAQAAEAKLVQIRLRSGTTIKARVGSGHGPDLASLHRELESSEFVQIGDDTVVRSSDVEYLQLSDSEPGLIESVKSRVSGGGSGGDGRDGHSSRREHTTQPRRFSGPRRLIETRPFFLTSEFILAFAAWLALMLTTLATDSLDADVFTLLTVAIAAGYMLSRGFAKAHAPSSAWDPREDWHSEH